MKKKILLSLLSILLIIGLIPQVRATTLNIKFEITGTNGLSFMMVFRDDSGYHVYEDDVIPKNYSGIFTSTFVTGMISKKESSGTLTASLYVDGVLRDSKTTTQSFGAISLLYIQDQQYPKIPGFELAFVFLGLISIVAIFQIKKRKNLKI